MRFDDTARKENAASIRAASALLCAGLSWMACGPVMAQVIVPGINAPSVIPGPTPPIQIPPIPQVGVPVQPTASPLLQDTFPDRVNACMQAGAAAGLSSGSLDTYTALCASQ